jgi:hypothetical protein
MAFKFLGTLGANSLFKFLFSVNLTFLLMLSTLSAFLMISFFIFLSRNTPIIYESRLVEEEIMVDFT